MTEADRDAIINGLTEIQRQIESGEFVWRADREDVHMNIEAALTDLVGEPAKKLHTARSRNDQVCTDVRLYCRNAISEMQEKIRVLQASLVRLAVNNEGLVVPGYTHLQRAQPLLLAHVLLAYVEMVSRDVAGVGCILVNVLRTHYGGGCRCGLKDSFFRSFTIQEERC